MRSDCLATQPAKRMAAHFIDHPGQSQERKKQSSSNESRKASESNTSTPFVWVKTRHRSIFRSPFRPSGTPAERLSERRKLLGTSHNVNELSENCASEDRYRSLADALEIRVQLRTQELERRNAELCDLTTLLQTREELLKTFVKHVPAAVAMLDRDMRYLQVSDRWCADYSLDSSQLLGRSHYEIFPDLPERWRQIHRRSLEGETLRAQEDGWDRAGGTTWLRWEVRPWQNRDGLPGKRTLIFSEDLTRRKHADEALSGLSRKLIEAHEQERTRIARELHDDVVQRLALLSLELEGVQEDVPDGASELRTRIGALVNETAQIWMMFNRYRTNCTLGNWNTWVLLKRRRTSAKSLVSARRRKLISRVEYYLLACQPSLLLLYSEFYKRPCATLRSIVG